MHLLEIVIFFVLDGVLLEFEFLTPLRIFKPPRGLIIDLSQLPLILLVFFILYGVPPILKNIKSISLLNLFYRPVRGSIGILFLHHFVIEIGIHFLFLLIFDLFGVFVYC